jgi:hypothetical protein
VIRRYGLSVDGHVGHRHGFGQHRHCQPPLAETIGTTALRRGEQHFGCAKGCHRRSGLRRVTRGECLCRHHQCAVRLRRLLLQHRRRT